MHSNKLWETDGVEAGTYLVQDINPRGGGVLSLYFYQDRQQARVHSQQRHRIWEVVLGDGQNPFWDGPSERYPFGELDRWVIRQNNGQILLWPSDSSGRYCCLWTIDGTPSGTTYIGNNECGSGGGRWQKIDEVGRGWG